MSRLKYVKGLLPLIGIIILIYLVLSIGVESIINVLLGVQPVYIIMAVCLLVPYLLIQVLKWKYILDRQGLRLGFGYLLGVYMIGQFYGVLTPGRLGTLIRIGYIKGRTGGSFGECSSNVILDKIIDLFGVFILGMIGILLLIRYLSESLIFVATLFFALFVLIFLFFTRRGFSSRALKIFYRVLVPRRFKSKAHETFDSFYKNMPGARRLIFPLVLIVFGWVVSFSSSYFLALSIGIEIPYYIFITVFPIGMLIGLVPITVGGWGTREATLIALFSIFGVSAGEVMALSIMVFLISSIIPAVIGAVLALRMK